MSVFQRHVFVCTRGDWCPSVDGDGIGVHAALKSAVADAGLSDRIRVNHAGCFSQCGHGPMVVVYPDDVWYAAVSPDDAGEIVSRHLQGGEAVERLRYLPGSMGAHKLPRDEDGRPSGRDEEWPAGGRR